MARILFGHFNHHNLRCVFITYSLLILGKPVTHTQVFLQKKRFNVQWNYKGKGHQHLILQFLFATPNILWLPIFQASLVAQMVKNLPAMLETQVRFLGWEDPMEKGMATQSSALAWRIPWTDA